MGNTKNDPWYERLSFCAKDAKSVAGDAEGRPSFRAAELIAAAARSLYNCTKIKQLPPLPPDGYKVVFCLQGGLYLPTLQPLCLLAAPMQAAELTDPSTPMLRIHPVNNTCTVSAVGQEDALKLVQLHKITYKKHECGELHQEEANHKCTPVYIICEGPHPSGSRECKHRHLSKVIRGTLERETRSQQKVDHIIPYSSAERTEQPANLRDGHSKSSNRPTWADKLKMPKGTSIPVTNTPPSPDPHHQELQALRVEVTRLMALITQNPAPSSSQLPPHPPTQTQPTAQLSNSSPTHTLPPHKSKRCSDSDNDYQADLRNLDAQFDAKIVTLEARLKDKFSTLA
ncbi:hypothetical protein HPB51_008928 [Rhipicephalus microplus]|uniref:Uncharacterized protein n=1 Tax=Rhipicephalus microplus TaxID=6941 RepID=A0A9J6E8C8_RHIMP|nr:hypothetical protein HPB51_008928 [Rhipicephalus microplus]